MNDILPFIIVGAATGSLYGLAGIGLVLTYRTSGVFNFAHGAIGAGAAFLFYSLHTTYGWPWPVAGLVTVALFGLIVGSVLEVLTRTLTGGSQVAVVMVTVGVILGTQGLLFLLYGDLARFYPPFLPQSGVVVAEVQVTWAQIISAAIALVSAALLYTFLRLTRLGVAMRAVVDNPQLVSLTGERPTRITRTAWMIGTCFAAVSGVLLGPTLGLDATVLTLLVVQSFGACAIGSFKSLPMTYLGGLIVGIGASLATKYLTERPWSGLPSAVPFLILIAVLLVVPARKLPRPRVGLGSIVPERPFAWTRPSAFATAVGAAGLVAVPFVVGNYLPVWINALNYVVLFGSLALLLWTSGQISLCHLAFAAIGATTLAQTRDSGAPWLVALLLGGLAAMPLGVIVAIPAIRMSGIYLGLMTIGFGILMQNVAFQGSFMFGVEGIVRTSRPSLGFIDGTNDRWYYAIVLVIAVLTMLVLLALRRGQLGRLLRAMSESPVMLSTHGLSVNLAKVLVFAISAFFAGIAGGLIITEFVSVSGQPFGPVQSLVLVAVLGICGQNLARSPILAAVLFTLVPGYVDGFDQNKQLLFFGVASVIAGISLANRGRLASWFERAASTSSGRRVRDPLFRPAPTRAEPQPGGVA